MTVMPILSRNDVCYITLLFIFSKSNTWNQNENIYEIYHVITPNPLNVINTQ